MALLECDRSRPIFFLRKTSSAPYPFHTTLKYNDQVQSASTSPHNKRKARLNHDLPIDDMIIDAKASMQMSSCSSDLIEKHQLFTRTTGLSPGARRLKVSSASVSPIKPVIIPKRLATSELSSPCPLKKRVGSLAISVPNNKQPSHESHCQTNSGSISSSQGEHESTNLSPGLSSPSMFPGLNEFSFCDQCSKLCSRSLDFWMDHLGECHPVPVSWPSVRADHLNERDKLNPYTAVVGSNKKRKGSAVPRPLNSFMIFAQYLRRVVLHWFPDAPNVHISQRVGQLWRKLDSNMREQYALEAFRLQKLHSIEFPNYKYQPRKRPHNVHANNQVSESKMNETPRSIAATRERNVGAAHARSTNSIPCSGIGKPMSRPSNPLNSHSIIYLNNLLQDYDASKIPALVIAHHGTQSGEIIVQESSKDSLKQFISSQNFTELKPFQICTTLPEFQKQSLGKYCLDKLLLSEGNQADETLTSLVSGENAEEQSPTISSTSNSTEIDGSIRSKSLDVNCSDEPLDYRFHNGRTHMIEDLLTATSVFCSTQIYDRHLTSRTSTNMPLLLDHSGVLDPTTELGKLEDIRHSERLINPGPFDIKLPTVPLQIAVPSNCSMNSDLVLREPIKLEMDDMQTDHSLGINSPKSQSKLSRFETSLASSRSSSNRDDVKTVTQLHGQTKVVSLDFVDGPSNSRFVPFSKSTFDRNQIGIDAMASASRSGGGGGSSSSNSSNSSTILSDSNRLGVYVDFDDLDPGFGFDDIDTCKSGTSLDDLDQIVLFNANIPSSNKSSTNNYNHNSQSDFNLTNGKPYDSDSLLTTVNEVLGTMTDTNGLPAMDPIPFNSRARTDPGTRAKSADFNLLPSIESWTFGALNGGN